VQSSIKPATALQCFITDSPVPVILSSNLGVIGKVENGDASWLTVLLPTPQDAAWLIRRSGHVVETQQSGGDVRRDVAPRKVAAAR
jgi:hypothetical protein